MGQLVPAHDDRRPGAQFAGEVRRVLTGRREIIAYRMQEKDPIVYYLDSPVSRLLTVCDVKRRLVRDGRGFPRDLRAVPGGFKRFPVSANREANEQRINRARFQTSTACPDGIDPSGGRCTKCGHAVASLRRSQFDRGLCRPGLSDGGCHVWGLW